MAVEKASLLFAIHTHKAGAGPIGHRLSCRLFVLYIVAGSCSLSGSGWWAVKTLACVPYISIGNLFVRSLCEA